MALNPYDGTFEVDVTEWDPNNPNCDAHGVALRLTTEQQKLCWEYGHLLVGQCGFGLPYTLFNTQIEAVNLLLTNFEREDDEGLALLKQHMETPHTIPQAFDPITDRVLFHYYPQVEIILRAWAEADRVEDFSGDNPVRNFVFHHEVLMLNPLSHLCSVISEETQCYWRAPENRSKRLKAALVNLIKTIHWCVLSNKQHKTSAEQEYFDLVTRLIAAIRPAPQNPRRQDGNDVTMNDEAGENGTNP